jgi:hypothetical protein
MSGVIALLAAAQALGEFDKSGWTKQLVFAFFAGESWGYIGSSRFVYGILLLHHQKCLHLRFTKL